MIQLLVFGGWEYAEDPMGIQMELQLGIPDDPRQLLIF